jgi:hypothetical protein
MELSGQVEVRQQRRLARRPVAVMILSTRVRPHGPIKAFVGWNLDANCLRNLRVVSRSTAHQIIIRHRGKSLESVLVISSNGRLIIVHRNDETRKAGNGALVFDRKRQPSRLVLHGLDFLCSIFVRTT